MGWIHHLDSPVHRETGPCLIGMFTSECSLPLITVSSGKMGPKSMIIKWLWVMFHDHQNPQPSFFRGWNLFFRAQNIHFSWVEGSHYIWIHRRVCQKNVELRSSSSRSSARHGYGEASKANKLWRPHTTWAPPKGSVLEGKWDCWLQGNLGWWNILLWPDRGWNPTQLQVSWK